MRAKSLESFAQVDKFNATLSSDSAHALLCQQQIWPQLRRLPPKTRELKQGKKAEQMEAVNASTRVG